MKNCTKHGVVLTHKEFYAHSLPGRPKNEWQRLEEHLENVAKMSERFAEEFSAGEWAYLAGLWHDIGKYSTQFQKMLAISANEETNDEIRKGLDHSSAGAQHAVKKFSNGVGKLLAYAIAGHHSGLLDAKANGACLSKRLSNADIPDYSSAPINILSQRLDSANPPINFGQRNIEVGFQLQLFIKMLFSSLVDADFLDTEKFMDIKRFEHRNSYSILSESEQKEYLQMLHDKLFAELQQISSRSTLSLVNDKRAEVLRQCVAAAQMNPGLFSLTVPTGGGKTLSSMAFALGHALKYGMKRIIYVIPYTSIIEQNADVFRRICGDAAILEHHCNYEPEEDSYRSQLVAENWDSPIIVTTNVQFFESLFHFRTSKCRKLHNIANSVIIFDEAQMLPVELLRPCLESIKELVKNYKVSVVLCSATQPALTKSEEFKIGLDGVREIISDPDELYRVLDRVKVSTIPLATDIEIANKIVLHKQVLCVVNTRKHARQLFDLISDKEGLYHLSALMCPVHRSKTISTIKKALKNDQKCRVISTQLIEAGVDIDFPVVYRAQAGIDSIAQSAGRCNREGQLSEHGNVIVFRTEKMPPIGYLRKSAETAEGVIRRHQNILSLSAVNDYFRELYWKHEGSLDKKHIVERLAEGVATYDFAFRTIGEDFKWIENGMQTVVVPYNDEAKELIRSLKMSDSKMIARKLQRFSVQVYPDVITKLGRVALEPVQERYYILINGDLYKDDIGLDWDDPYFRNIENNIC